MRKRMLWFHSEYLFKFDFLSIQNGKVYLNRKGRMNEIADDRYCATKINHVRMFLSTSLNPRVYFICRKTFLIIDECSNYARLFRDTNTFNYLPHVRSIEFLLSSFASSVTEVSSQTSSETLFRRFVVFSRYSTDNLTWKVLCHKERTEHAMICQWRVRHPPPLLSLLFKWCIFVCVLSNKDRFIDFHSRKKDKQENTWRSTSNSSVDETFPLSLSLQCKTIWRTLLEREEMKEEICPIIMIINRSFYFPR